MNTFKTIQKYFYLTLISLGIIFFIYVRFIAERLPTAFSTMTEYQKLSVIFAIICIILSIYVQLKFIIKKTENAFSRVIKLKLYKISLKLYNKLIELYEILWDITSRSGFYPYELLIKIAKICDKKNNKKIYGITIILIEILPKILFHVALFIDVVYLQAFCYSYKLLFLLLVPAIMTLFLFLMQDFYDRYYEFSNNLILTKTNSVDGITNTVICFKPEFADEGLDITFFFTNHLQVLAHIPHRIYDYTYIKYTLLGYSNIILLLSLSKLMLLSYVLCLVYI